MIAPISEAEFGEEAIVELNRDSAARYPAFIADVEAELGPSDRLPPVRNAPRGGRRRRARRPRARVPAPPGRSGCRWCGSQRVRPASSSPGLRHRSAAGCSSTPTTSVDPRALTAALLTACSQSRRRDPSRSGSAVASSAAGSTGVRVDGEERDRRRARRARGRVLVRRRRRRSSGGQPAGAAGQGPDPPPARRAGDDLPDDPRQPTSTSCREATAGW